MPSTQGFRDALESTLNELLERELPRVREEARPDLSRMLSSSVASQRSRAHQRQKVDEALAQGHGQLTYDVQSFRLAPDAAALHFVRAEWRVGQRQGFAASVWLRGEQRLETVKSDVKPASWLRMFEFQGKVAREHLGMILNVLDRDQDGWGEVLFAQGGYESMGITLLELSPGGFEPTGIGFSCGC